MGKPLFLGAILMGLVLLTPATRAEKPIDIGSRLELFADDFGHELHIGDSLC